MMGEVQARAFCGTRSWLGRSTLRGDVNAPLRLHGLPVARAGRNQPYARLFRGCRRARLLVISEQSRDSDYVSAVYDRGTLVLPAVAASNESMANSAERCRAMAIRQM